MNIAPFKWVVTSENFVEQFILSRFLFVSDIFLRDLFPFLRRIEGFVSDSKTLFVTSPSALLEWTERRERR